MPLRNRILDNQAATVADHLRHNLRSADAFDLASAYFTIYGYQLLADELDKVGGVRFLFGDPTSVEDLDPTPSAAKSFELTERGLEPNHTLQQKALAKRCADWIAKDTIKVRSISRANFLHGKMYLTASTDSATGVVGSSNFTKRGLGGSDRPNLEINLATDDADTLAELQDWFNRLWSDGRLTEDVKQRVLDALQRIGGDYAPEAVYYKTLYELFRKDIEARLAGDTAATATGFTDSQIWNALYEFQKDGAKSVIAKLQAHNGCILVFGQSGIVS
jgi:phosphatidylserine/phosphatidylglycerophosphate/cardiolipin synthase-like enzyme